MPIWHPSSPHPVRYMQGQADAGGRWSNQTNLGAACERERDANVATPDSHGQKRILPALQRRYIPVLPVLLRVTNSTARNHLGVECLPGPRLIIKRGICEAGFGVFFLQKLRFSALC